MHITRFLIRSFRIVERVSLDTDTLDPGYLESACETLARAHATLSPLRVSEEGEEAVYLGLGWPEDIREFQAEPGAQLMLGQLFAEMPEPTGTVFYLHHQGAGPVYVVLPAEQEEGGADEEDGGEEETAVDDLLADLRSMQSGDLAEKAARFNSMWEEALRSLPVVLQFGPGDWGEEWDEFAMYIAVAILLEHH